MKIRQEVEGDQAAQDRKRPISFKKVLVAQKVEKASMLSRLVTTTTTTTLAILLLIAWLPPFAVMTQAQDSVNSLIANVIGARIKSFQVSACDGEQLSIRCNEDLLIDVITAEYTIIPNSGFHETSPNVKQQQQASTSTSANGDEKQQQQLQKQLLDTRVSQQQPIESLAVAAAPTRTGNDANSGGDNNSLCPPLAANATNYNYNNSTSHCNEQQASKATEGANVSEIVRLACHLRNSCSFDMRQQQQQQEQQQQVASTQTNNASNIARKSSSNFLKLQKLTNEVCPGNRKLLEVVYKCRPTRLIRRYNCRGEQMQLDCQPGKRILLGYARYGSSASETKIHERCQTEAPTSNATAATTTATIQPITGNATLSASSSPLNRTAQYRDCLSQDENSNEQYNQMCLYKQHCRLEVQPQLLGDPHCPAGQPEYLRVIFVCFPQELIAFPNTNTSSALIAANANKTSGPLQTIQNVKQNEFNQQQFRQQPFASANVSSSSSSSSLLYYAPTQNQAPTSLSVAASVQQAPTSNGPQYTQLQPGNTELTDLVVEPNYQNNNNNSIYTAVASDPNLLTKHPKFWSPSQKVGFLIARYQPQVLAFTCLSLCALFLALMVRGCRRLSKSSRCSTNRSTGGSSTGSGSAKNSHSSCLSTSTLSAGQCQRHHQHQQQHQYNTSNRNSSSTPTTFAAGHNLTSAVASNLLKQQPAHLKHNSCSESCFSLEDYHIGPTHNSISSNHSPALDSIDGCGNAAGQTNSIRFNGNGNAIQQQQHQAVRPKLWSIYGVHNNINNNNNNISEQQTMTLRNNLNIGRPTNQRTFLGPPPPPLAPQLQLQLNQPEQQQQQQQQPNQTRQQHNLASIRANELLLALAASASNSANANNQQAAAAAAAAADNNNIDSWCATLQPQQQQQRAAVAMNSSDELQLQQQHLQTYSSSSSGQQQQQQQHCAFHQQQLYGVLPSPTALQLEPIVAIGSNDLVMPINLQQLQQQQQFEQSQQFQSMLQVQQQQQQQPGANLK